MADVPQEPHGVVRPGCSPLLLHGEGRQLRAGGKDPQVGPADAADGDADVEGAQAAALGGDECSGESGGQSGYLQRYKWVSSPMYMLVA